MQLNIYIPRDKQQIVDALNRAAELTGRPKGEIVCEAIERHLPTIAPVTLGKFALGLVRMSNRGELYEERLMRD